MSVYVNSCEFFLELNVIRVIRVIKGLSIKRTGPGDRNLIFRISKKKLNIMSRFLQEAVGATILFSLSFDCCVHYIYIFLGGG